MEKIPSYKPCFFCGKENPYGLQLDLFAEGEEIRSEFQVAERYCGLQGFIHGAILFGVLDEVMWWAASWQQSSACLTMEMTVRYRRAASVDRKYQALARVAKNRNRVVEVLGEIKELTSMAVCVTGKGKYYLLTGERNREIISSMDFSRCSPQTRSKYEGKG